MTCDEFRATKGSGQKTLAIMSAILEHVSECESCRIYYWNNSVATMSEERVLEIAEKLQNDPETKDAYRRMSNNFKEIVAKGQKVFPENPDS